MMFTAPLRRESRPPVTRYLSQCCLSQRSRSYQRRFFLSLPGQSGRRRFICDGIRLLFSFVFDHLSAHDTSQHDPQKTVYFHIEPAVAKEIDNEDACHQQGETQTDRLEKRILRASVKP